MAHARWTAGARATPAGVNATMAALFALGSACFVVGSVPAYADAVGGTVDGVTFVIGSVFFTAASFAQLVRAQTPELLSTRPEAQRRPARPRWWAWAPHDRSWVSAATQLPGPLFFNVSTTAALAHNATVQQENQHVWRPDIFGSTLFLVSSGYGVLAAAGQGSVDVLPRVVAWVNLLGSVLFMASALASYVLPDGEDLDEHVAVTGTLLGAVCFLIGALLLVPAWNRAVRRSTLPGGQS